MAVAAAVIWAVYSTLTKKISALGHGTVQSTRRTFFYGILFMVPALAFMDFYVTPAQFTDMKNILNLLFLGLGASAPVSYTHLDVYKRQVHIMLRARRSSPSYSCILISVCQQLLPFQFFRNPCPD